MRRQDWENASTVQGQDRTYRMREGTRWSYDRIGKMRVPYRARIGRTG
jgi:hypothetical protein